MIHENFDTITRLLENWWNNGSQVKPLISAVINNSRPTDSIPLADYWTDVDGILSRFEQKLKNARYYGVAVPYHHIDFSATAMACSLSGRIEYVNEETVWSHPVFNDLEHILHVKLSPDNISYKTQIETTKRSAARANSRYFVSPWNLGGILDIMSGLYPTENLLMDLATCPDKVKQVMNRLTDLWLEEFQRDIDLIETSKNPGHVCGWVGIWAPGSSFPIQEDFAYMISPDMFNEYCLPCIRKMVNAMEYPLFHLDGVGMIPHLDYLLAIERLRAIQWQPGSGKEDIGQWHDLVKKIVDAGKSCQVFVKADEIEPLIDRVGPDRLLCILRDPTEADIEKLAKKNLL